MNKHVRLLGILNIVWGSFGLIGAMVTMLIFGSALGIIGMAGHGGPRTPLAMSLVGLVGGILFLLILITSLPSVVAGIGLLRSASWARIFTLVLSGLHLFSIPFGTALGIYGFWVLLSEHPMPVPNHAKGPIRL
jgi:hypothetical protein